MATTKADYLAQWLRDAHAMEEQAEQMLGSTAERVEAYPELRQRLLQHQTETRDQARLIQSCLARYETSNSALKDMAGKATALAQSVSGLFVSDEVVKGLMAGITFEHMEVAAYSIIVAAARRLGDNETVEICSRILLEEDEMAAWLEEKAPEIVEQFLAAEATSA
ncbi:ferritin-like domain-containing protein [Roseomonas terrae]|uniref:Ferritin-like domain-containing protein n=1 Tax=Neoroseomonas terrae TaxID=424799 RepID=A0ABS5EG26_9PROT|nr:ferritin-like domain-containing protein [Neoroseomonas terrae]MBR0649974.1 ferritin-like domain-containing protein [Neoroseomonas terrae]